MRKFTQKERDDESGLDYFLARYYSSARGRFTSVDPITVTPPRMVDPQQLNLHGYVRNNPLAYIDPTGVVIDVSRLSEDDLKKWKRIEELANGKDNKGNYVNSKLHEIYDRLQSDKRTFFMENHSFGDNSGTIGETNITKHNGKDDFTKAVIQIDFKKAKSTETTTAADLVAGFNKFEGLLGQGDKGVDARRAEVFGHEGSHGIWDLDNPAEAVKLQMQLADRDAALAALPIKGRYPLPPDVMRKFADADKALVPTERFAQQAEKIVNGELRASIKH